MEDIVSQIWVYLNQDTKKRTIPKRWNGSL